MLPCARIRMRRVWPRLQPDNRDYRARCRRRARREFQPMITAPETRRTHHHDRRRQHNRHALEYRPGCTAASRDRVLARAYPAERPTRWARLRRRLRPSLCGVSRLLGARNRTTRRPLHNSVVRRRPLRRCLARKRRAVSARPVQHRRAVPVALALGPFRRHHLRRSRDCRGARRRGPGATHRRRSPRSTRPTRDPDAVRQFRDVPARPHDRSHRGGRRHGDRTRRRALRWRPLSRQRRHPAPDQLRNRPARTPQLARRSGHRRSGLSTTSASSPCPCAGRERQCSRLVRTPVSSTSASRCGGRFRINRSASCSAASIWRAPRWRTASIQRCATSPNSSNLESVAPGHCTGWRGATALVNAFGPTRFAPSVVGTRYLINAS